MIEATLRPGRIGMRTVHVRLWAGGPPIVGRVRELAPVADPATRTFPARIALLDPPPNVALGMTATVTFATPTAQPIIAVPLQSLQAEGGVTHTWLFDPDLATSSVVVDGFLLFGLKTLTGGRRAFVNFTRNLLINDYARVLPPEQVVVEILESVVADVQVVAACRDLRARGYMLALDDFAFGIKHRPLVGLVDIVKIDFRQTKVPGRQDLMQACANRGITFLAEKVETRSQNEQDRQMGCSLFQGYSFGKPEILSSREIPAHQHNYYHLLQAIQQPQPNLIELEEIIKHETSLSYKLLRYLNSAAFAFRMEIRSIRHALALLE